MVEIDRARCSGCGSCVEACAAGAMTIREGLAHVDAERCTACGACVEVCPQEAISLLVEVGPRALTIPEPGIQPAGRPAEAIAVRVPPSPPVPSRPAPARPLAVALGAALSYLGRELAPQLVRLATGWVGEQLGAPRASSPRRSGRQGDVGRRRLRRYRRRRGRE